MPPAFFVISVRILTELSNFCADSKQLKLQSQIEEMNALQNAGQMTNQRYIDLTYIVAEHEEEEEQRDQSRVSKITKSVLNHSSYSCIGSSTCLKQKNIRKLFPQSLKQIEKHNKLN